MGDLILSMKGITKSFSGVAALKNAALDLKAGEVVALMGENGAGKSTLMKILTGIYSKDSGEIQYMGQEVCFKGPAESEEAGISIVHQELNMMNDLTVAQNLFIGREEMNGFLIDDKKMNEKARELFKVLKIDINPAEKIGNLTVGKQQMVEIAKALSEEAKVLIMDEPTSSISDREVENLFNIMRDLTKKGVGIIYISHKMSELEEICDRVTVMRDGEYVGTKVVKDTNKEELIAMMVGRTLTNYYVRDFMPSKEIILKVENLSDGNKVKDVSFELKKGEIIGFAGLVGAGRSETMEAIFGLSKGVTGTIYIDGNKVDIKDPRDAIKNGLALVPESRKEQGLYLIQDIKYNTTIEVLDEFIKNLNVNVKKETEITKKYIDMMNTKTPSQEQIIGNLSGGNQQKVMIGRWLATNPKILILDEPTRGIDVGAKSEIYKIMNELVKSGVSIIMISSELPEIINMSDRVYVMAAGMIRGCIEHEEISQESIMALAAI